MAVPDGQNREVCPLWRKDFSGVPKVHIVTGDYEPLRDEGVAVYQRHTAQGVKCTA
ncbi:alpha/beta hydrolase fold domain-containing protein, partial [Enterobacter hormaechei]